MNIGEINTKWTKLLTAAYGEDEAKAIVREAIALYLDMSPVDIVLRRDFEPASATIRLLEDALSRVMAGEPIQYILGESWFHGLKISVSPAVLIPRKETSQLVDIIIAQWKDRTDLSVADICCGSGAIACALSRALPFSSVTGVDISPSAIEISKTNAAKLKCNINWLIADILNPAFTLDGKFDIIVSNPPYIPFKEKNLVDDNVLRYEPHQALFVPDSDPLIFYKAIGKWALNHLAEGGILYFEINPGYADSLSQLLTSIGYRDVNILKDFTGKNRFATACL